MNTTFSDCTFTEESGDEITNISYLEKQIEQQRYQTSVELLLPVQNESDAITTKIVDMVDSLSYYEFTGSPDILLFPDLYNNLLHSGKAFLISQAPYGSDDQISTVNGKLHVTLSKDSFLQTGLDAHPASSKTTNSLWHASYDLKTTFLQSHRKGFERLKSALGRFNNQWTFYMGIPPEHIDESFMKSLKKSFPVPLIQHHLRVEKSVYSSVIIPPLISSLKNIGSTDDSIEKSVDTLEQMSLLLLNADVIHKDYSSDPYICSYKPNSNSTSDILAISIVGLFDSSVSMRVYNLLRDLDWGFCVFRNEHLSSIPESLAAPGKANRTLLCLNQKSQNIRWTWKIT
ncbi:RNase P and RNase MRP subunit Rpp40 [Schizosaccharomyces osmophilus]|uniref:RNase P and RNase MRP subunit Rpp40 n=1 Tax=Schizosaccharomyces osmophilus TaxID=2545709 RepID=A0AAE9WF50_9SCHI|nr:RNase P and RNase MRP subunit Rpp40 [Schizosaccharomyces osmophilus]WBW73628.1 RNase P and RNase MRP subunit Rpp40 [Schizosaccharomyces osmophilus]